MSLILEALKKSEAERQRQTGPTLLEVRVAKPRRPYPVWALAIGGLLAVNMLLLLFFVLRRPAVAPSGAPATATAAAATAPTPALSTAAPAPQPGPAAPSASVTTPVAPPQQSAAMAAGGASSFAPALDDDSTDAPVNPADEQPAVARTSGSVRMQRETSGDYSNLPSFSELGGNLPDFRLDLHAYSERARDRYAMINMHTVHEGDMLPEGARVLAITRDGVALEFRGQQFMLRPQ